MNTQISKDFIEHNALSFLPATLSILEAIISYGHDGW